jgi:uncharacterized protein (DUF2147 family)
MKKLLFLLILFCPLSLLSQVSSILGTWRTIDEKTNEAKSIVRIYKEADGKYYGKIEKLLLNPNAKCDNCEGEEKGKPVLGMIIITDMKEKGDKLDGGLILDPANGKRYNATISLEKNGKLKLRGSLDKMGVLGRNQYWERVE